MDKRELLKNIRLFVLDLDGTFYLGERLLPDSLRFLERVKETGRRFLFFTNNSSKTPELYIEKLGGMGVQIGHGDILTSGDVCIDYLNNNHAEASVYLMGTAALKEEFARAGVLLVNRDLDCRDHAEDAFPRNDEGGNVDIGDNLTPDVVVCAFDTELTYEKLERACTFIRNGALFLATHEDINCPTEDGFIPDCGSMCAAIMLSTNVVPKYLGKPHSETVERILALTGAKREELAFIGDRLYTDVAAGVQNGAAGLLVLSGETKAADVAASAVKPDAVFSGLGEIADLL